VAALGFTLARDAHYVLSPRSLGHAIKFRRRRLLFFLSSVSRRRRLSSGELPSPPQRKPVSTKQCSSSVSSLRTHPTNCGCLSPLRTAASDPSSSRPATSPEAPFHRGQRHPVSRCPCLLSLQLHLNAVVLNPFLLGRFAHCSHQNSIVDEVCSVVTAVTVDPRYRSFSGLILCVNTFGVSS